MIKRCELCGLMVGNLNSFLTKKPMGNKMVCEGCYRKHNNNNKILLHIGLGNYK